MRNVEASTRFYVDGLGFEAMQGGTAEGIGALLSLPGAKAQTQFVRHPSGGTIELWNAADRETPAPQGAMPSNLSGRLHLCLIVDDLDGTARRIADHGGTPLDETRTELDYGKLMFCEDPDGVRIEIIEMKGAWQGY